MDAIKSAIKNENYEEAYKLCEDLLLADSKNGNYQLLSFLAMSSMKLEKKEDRTIFAFEKALTLSETPADQHQKIWKHLTQLYESKGMWNKVAHGNTQLYIMVKEKGNIERMIVLADVIAENYLKTTGSYQVACDFIANHVLLLGSSHHTHCIKMISYLHDFYSSFLNEQKGNSNNISSLGSASTAASDEQKRETQMIIDGFDTYDTDKVVQLLIECLKINNSNNNNIGEIDGKINKILLRYLMNKRLRALTKHYNGQSNISQWKDILTLGLSYYSLLGCKEETLDFVDVIMEAWIFSPQEPYDTIASIVEDVLAICPSHPSTNIGKLFRYCEEGLVFSSVSHASHCMNYWTSSKTTLSANSENVSELLYDIKSSIATWSLFMAMIINAFMRYRDTSFHDLQHYSQEMKLRFNTINQYFSDNIRRQFNHLIPLVKVMSASVIGFGHDAYKEEQLQLPKVFSISLSQIDESHMTEISELPITVQWLSIIVFYSLEFYNEVNLITAFLLAKNPIITSWIISEQSYSQLLLFISNYKQEKRLLGECISPISLLCRDMILNEGEMTKLIKAFQSALKTGDKVSNSIEVDVRFRIGLSLWLAGGKLRSDPNGSIASFLLSAKLDPNAGQVYSYIGHYYYLEKRDKERAIKCYLKALGSNSLDVEAGLALSQIYLTDGQEEKAIKLWNDICELSSNCAWCFSLRGKYYLCKGDYGSAITWYQRAVELNADDVNSWHGLGLSYSNLQQNTAAFKAISKACKLAPNDIHINVALADMERRMCMPIDANKRYDKLLKLAPHDELVLKGAATCCLVLAYHNYSFGWTFGAAISIVNGIKHIETLIKIFEAKSIGNKFESIWKLLGDLSSFAINVLTDLAFIKSNDINSFSIFKTPLHISGLGSGDLLVDSKALLISFLKRGEEAYRKVIEIQEKNGGINSESWYDLGMIIYSQVITILTLKGQGSVLLSKLDLLDATIAVKVEEAKACFIKGLRLNPACSNCFNGLGVTIVNDDVVRQACFVKAIQCNNNTSALLNLGLLFLRHNLESSAKSCLSSLQLIESSPQTWIAFGQLYENKSTGGSTAVKDEDVEVDKNLVSAQDAYYAALEVAKPVDAMYGAAISWLKLHNFLSDKGLYFNAHITPNTFEAIQIRYEVEMKIACCLRRNPINPLGWIILAWCLEVRGAFKDATRVNEKGMKVLDIIAASAAKGEEKLTDDVIESLNISAKALVSSLKRCCANEGISIEAYLQENQIPNSLKNLARFVKLNDIIVSETNNKSFNNGDYDSTVELIITSFRTSSVDVIVPMLEKAFQYCLNGSKVSLFASLIQIIRSLMQETKDSNFLELVRSFLSTLLSNLSPACEQPNKDMWQSLILQKSWVLAFFIECASNKEMKNMVLEIGLNQYPSSALLWIMKAEETDDLNEINGYAEKAIEIGNDILRSPVIDKAIGSGLGKSLTDIQLENECPWLSTLDLITCATALRCVNNIVKGTFDKTSKSAILRCLRLDPSNEVMWLLLSYQTYFDVLLTSDDTREYAYLQLVSRISKKFENDNDIKISIKNILETLSSSAGSEVQYFKDNIDKNANSFYYLGCLYSNKKFTKSAEFCFMQANLDDDFRNILLSILYLDNNNDTSRAYAEKSKYAAAKIIEAYCWLNISKKNKAVKVLSEALKEWKYTSIPSSFTNLLTIVDEASSTITIS